MIILNWVFYGHDMMVKGFINIINHSSKRCRFAATGRPGHKEQATRPSTKSLAYLRQTNFLKSHNPRGDKTKHQRNITLLFEYRHTEATLVAKCKSIVRTTFLLQFLLITFGGNTFHQGRCIVRLENFSLQRP